MVPVLPIEWMTSSIHFMCCFFTMLTVVFGMMLSRQ